MIIKIIERCHSLEASVEGKHRMLNKINIKRDLELSEEVSSEEVAIRIETIRTHQTFIITIKKHLHPTMVEVEAEAEVGTSGTKEVIMIDPLTMKIINNRNIGPRDILTRNKSSN